MSEKKWKAMKARSRMRLLSSLTPGVTLNLWPAQSLWITYKSQLRLYMGTCSSSARFVNGSLWEGSARWLNNHCVRIRFTSSMAWKLRWMKWGEWEGSRRQARNVSSCWNVRSDFRTPSRQNKVIRLNPKIRRSSAAIAIAVTASRGRQQLPKNSLLTRMRSPCLLNVCHSPESRSYSRKTWATNSGWEIHMLVNY